jgi:Flp pilus assembly CpaF family ATPase
MRMGPDRFMVDEPLKGPATYDVLRAMITTRGSVITHSASGSLAPSRLMEGILQHPDGPAAAVELLARSIDVIVDMKQRGAHPEHGVTITIHRAADLLPAY